MSDKKRTAVDQLVEYVDALFMTYIPDARIPQDVVNRYKELEKQQHGSTWDAAVEAANNRTLKERAICDFDNYYSETYEK